VDPVTQVELRVPSYATPESAIRREALRRDGRLRIVRLVPERTASWPLWEAGSDYVDSDQYGLSEELQSALRHWTAHWEETFDIDTGWPVVGTWEAWADEGDLLADRLQHELWDVADVVAEHRTYSKVSVS
jgi:hypothetical protein